MGKELDRPSTRKSTGPVRKRRLPLMTSLRTILMTITSRLLIFCLVLEGYQYWYSVFSCPMNCARQDLLGNYGGAPPAWSASNVVLLLMGHPSSVMSLSNTGVRFQRDIRFKYMARLDERLTPDAPSMSISARLYLVVRAIARYG